MTEASRRLLSAFLLAGALSLLLILQAAAYYQTAGVYGGRIWKDRYLLLLDPSYPSEKAETLLKRNGFGNVLHRGNAEVEIPRGMGTETLRLAELSQRLVPEDPRRDPYLQKLPGLFRAGGPEGARQVFYVKTDQSLWQFRRTVQRLFPEQEGNGAVAEWNLQLPLTALALGGLALIPLLLLYPRRALFILLGSLFWVPLVVHSGGALVPLALVLHGLWIRWLNQMLSLLPRHRRMPGRDFWVSTIILGVSLPMAAVYVGFVSGGLFVFLAGFLSEILLGLFLCGGLLLASARHTLFDPIPICRWKPSRDRKAGLSRRGLIFVILTVLPLFPLVLGQANAVSKVPMPGRGGFHRSYTLEALHSLARSGQGRSGGGLPHAGDYTAHQAYLEGYPFGREYGLPRPGETVSLSRYIRQGQEIDRREEAVVRFDEAWMDGMVKKLSPVGELLFSPEAPVSVVVSHRLGPGLSWFSAMQMILICLVLAFPLYWSSGGLTAAFLYDMTKARARRRTQAA